MRESIEEMRSRLADIVTELKEIANENYGQTLDSAEQERWDSLDSEQTDLKQRITDTEDRQAYLDTLVDDKPKVQPTRDRDDSVYVQKRTGRNQIPQDVFAIEQYHSLATSRDHFQQITKDGARAALDQIQFSQPNTDQADAREHVERLMDQDSSGEMVQRVLLHGSPDYRAAYWKTMLRQPLSRNEQNALAAGMALEDRSITTSNTGGITVPIQIDPTVIPVSNGVLNPVRMISNVITTTSHQYQAVTSSGVTATRRSEGAAMTDNAPTLVAPTITPSRVNVFIPFSWEAAADWGALEAQLAPLISDAKDVEEAASFVNGNGTAPNPSGFMTYAGTVLGTAATVVIGTVDLLALQDALPARYQANATWLMAPAMTSKVRGLTSTAQGSWWAESLQAGVPSRLLGYPIYRQTNVGTAGSGSPPVASVKWGIIGDFRYFQIVDRVGLQTRYIDNLFSGNTAGAFGYPVGMSGLVAYYRNGCNILTSNAFRVGTVT
jgi:HK97 family phage major capsid protein